MVYLYAKAMLFKSLLEVHEAKKVAHRRECALANVVSHACVSP